MIEILHLIVNIILLALAVEAITEIITSSEIMSPLRLLIREKAFPYPPEDDIQTRFYAWLDKLISCGYCTSVWISALISVWYDYVMVNSRWMSTIILIFAIHRLANWIHVLYELIRKGRVGSLEVDLRVKDGEDGTNGAGSVEGTTET